MLTNIISVNDLLSDKKGESAYQSRSRLNWPQFMPFKATNLSEGGSDNSNPSQIPLETRSLITPCILQNVHNKTYILYHRLMLQSTLLYGWQLKVLQRRWSYNQIFLHASHSCILIL